MTNGVRSGSVVGMEQASDVKLRRLAEALMRADAAVTAAPARPIVGVATQPTEEPAMSENEIITLRAEAHAAKLLITVLLRATADAGLINLGALSEHLDASMVAAASQHAIAESDKETASRGLEIAQSIVRLVAHTIETDRMKGR